MQTAAEPVFVAYGPNRRAGLQPFDVNSLFGTKRSQVQNPATPTGISAGQTQFPELLGPGLPGRQVRLPNLLLNIVRDRASLSAPATRIQAVRKQVSVGVERHRRENVTEHGLDALRVRAGRDRQRRGGVPQILRRDQPEQRSSSRQRSTAGAKARGRKVETRIGSPVAPVKK